MCRVLGLSTSGYHDWLHRRRSQRTCRDDELKVRIKAIWRESDETYGSPRIHAALRAEGDRVGRKRVSRRMKALGIEGVTRRRFRTGTTNRDTRARPAPDLVKRDFSADGPAHAGRTGRGRAGDGDLATTAEERDGSSLRQGSQYTSLAFGERCRKAGIVQSMGSVGDAYDNAMCESFFATLECELLDRRRFATVTEARREVFGFIEGFYNTRRLHSALGYASPANFEKLNHAA